MALGGEGGAFFRVMGYHPVFFGVFFLTFGVFKCRTIFSIIFCTLSQNSIALGGVVVVLWSSTPRGWLLRAVAGVHKSYAMHKSPTVHVTNNMDPADPWLGRERESGRTHGIMPGVQSSCRSTKPIREDSSDSL
jgi:uncharacterized membrane protein